MLVHRGSLSSLHAAAASLAVAVVLLACTAPTAYGEDEAIAAPWDPYGVCYGKKYGASCDHPDAKYKCMEAYCGWDAYQDMYCVEGFKSLCKANLQCKKFKGCYEGTCQYENVEDGSSCDYDGNPCTQDYCRDGTCVMGPVKKCDYGASDYDAECVAPTYCDSKTRACPKKPYLYNGSDCSKAVAGKGLCKGSCSSGYCEVDKSYKTCTAAADDKDNGNSGGKGSKP